MGSTITLPPPGPVRRTKPATGSTIPLQRSESLRLPEPATGSTTPLQRSKPLRRSEPATGSTARFQLSETIRAAGSTTLLPRELESGHAQDQLLMTEEEAIRKARREQRRVAREREEARRRVDEEEARRRGEEEEARRRVEEEEESTRRAEAEAAGQARTGKGHDKCVKRDGLDDANQRNARNSASSNKTIPGYLERGPENPPGRMNLTDAVGGATSGADSWKRAEEVTQRLKARIELMKAKQGLC
ncbi:uncharacterized protein BDZ99DRAFT_463981 [Mytilinidion resinicola]|uniref:Stu2 C-terminal segment domain-containing protein n=1 Tax=Mytilinidion resinicola TaxID=574789 RepID=A0A6A6YKV3_9PEZI|nr:uncharacterized protein BDZ99DRAFT_463981 [Mytilinidion resinicola]KAF2809183.1 hypothetical protein BDZ99DRAFT_463981 [Mytilinidion resinicola]